MKAHLANSLKKIISVLLVATFALSFPSNSSSASETSWNKGAKVNYEPSAGAKTYQGSDKYKSLDDLYQLTWYEQPTRQVLKGEFMLLQLRIIQASLERRGMDKLTVTNGISLDYQDSNTLTASAQEEALVLKSLGIMTATKDGYMNLANAIKRSEIAKVLYTANRNILHIPSIRLYEPFADLKGKASEKYVFVAYQINLMSGTSKTKFSPDSFMTIEETLNLFENEIGYYGILREDVAKAFEETFKVTTNTEISNSKTYPRSYVKYEEKMKTYGFAELYNNKSAKSSESVTNEEAYKMALAVTLNTNDISEYFYDEEPRKTMWYEFAIEHGITDEDSASNAIKAEYIDAILYFEKCKVEFLIILKSKRQMSISKIWQNIQMNSNWQ